MQLNLYINFFNVNFGRAVNNVMQASFGTRSILVFCE